MTEDIDAKGNPRFIKPQGLPLMSSEEYEKAGNPPLYKYERKEGEPELDHGEDCRPEYFIPLPVPEAPTPTENPNGEK